VLYIIEGVCVLKDWEIGERLEIELSESTN